MRFSLNDAPLYIQTPKCKTKQVIAKTSGKRAFLDLVFTIENEEFIQWVENLETHCQKFIFQKRDRWFDSTLEESDIENLFTSILKSVKMGKFYILRATLPIATSTLKVYDENENLMNLEDLKEDTNLICILEFQGIKCSARGFQPEIEVKQVLVLKPANLFDRCILSKKKGTLPENLAPIPIPVLEAEPELEPEQKPELEMEPIMIPAIGDLSVSELTIKDDPLAEKDEEEDHENEEGQEEKKDVKKESSEEILPPPPSDNDGLLEIDFNLEELPPEDSMVLKQRNDVYYEMYKEALKKAKMAKDLALSSYLEAKRIKNLYMLDDLSDDSDMEEIEDFIGEDNTEEDT